jgi:hypothetical protein
MCSASWTLQVPVLRHEPGLQQSWHAPPTVHLPALCVPGTRPSPIRQIAVTANQTLHQSACDSREIWLQQLQFLKFSGDRDTKSSSVERFLQVVSRYGTLGGGLGVSADDRLIIPVLENLFRGLTGSDAHESSILAEYFFASKPPRSTRALLD